MHCRARSDIIILTTEFFSLTDHCVEFTLAMQHKHLIKFETF